MNLDSLTVKNFRALESISVTLDPIASVIVGPNAVGKTTVLEALRLVKGTLAPRTGDETQNVFASLGAFSPHNPQRINYHVLARDPLKAVNISAAFRLEPAEISQLDSLAPDLATALVRANAGANMGPQGQFGLVQFLSSAVGVQALASARTYVDAQIERLKANSRIALDLTMDPSSGTIKGANQIDQLVFASLESKLPPNQSLFSYFPADRALPAGEVVVQVGGPDAGQQLQSHNSTPQLKYNRLKPTIINSMLLDVSGRQKLDEDFKKIFSRLLKDRALAGSSVVNDFGMISIQIKDIANGRTFDIDQMSSGEKGLILTFLLIRSSVAEGGIILVDEPELHLNPAVCKLLLPFLIDECLKPKKIQAIICSHSPELLGTAFDRKDCSLYHLQSETVISKIFPEDKREVFDALRRLGTTASDVLFSKGSIFVEGDQDVEILEIGFNKLLSKFKITQLGGRGNVEKEIKTLQKAAPQSEIETLKCFIFDLDNVPTGLTSTNMVRVLQWKRRCLENFLIDGKIIYDLLRDSNISSKLIPSRGEVPAVFRAIAISQLHRVVVERVYDNLGYENPGFRSKDAGTKTFGESAMKLFERLKTIQGQLCSLRDTDWCEDFTRKCDEEHSKLLAVWEADWLTLCDGKRFFSDLLLEFGVRISPQQFKRLIIERMENERSEGWAVVESQLSEAIGV